MHGLQGQLQSAQGQVAQAHRLSLEACVAADAAIESACHQLDALEPQLQHKISQAEQVPVVSRWSVHLSCLFATSGVDLTGRDVRLVEVQVDIVVWVREGFQKALRIQKIQRGLSEVWMGSALWCCRFEGQSDTFNGHSSPSVRCRGALNREIQMLTWHGCSQAFSDT